MQVFPERLVSVLAEKPTPVYILGGEEPVLLDEARAEIVAFAKRAGIEDFETIHLDESRTRVDRSEWVRVFDELVSETLFGTRRLIEVHTYPTVMERLGWSLVESYLRQPSSANLLVIRLREFQSRVKRSSWFAVARKHPTVAVVVTSEMSRTGFKRWIRRTAASLSFKLTEDAVEVLLDYCDGNTLAAKQELMNLQLTVPEGARVDASSLLMSDQSQSELRSLVNSACSGDASGVVKSFNALERQRSLTRGSEIFVLRSLERVLERALDSNNRNRTGFGQQQSNALFVKHGAAGIERLLEECAYLHSLTVGMARGLVSVVLLNLLLAVAGSTQSNLRTEFPWRKIDRRH